MALRGKNPTLRQKKLIADLKFRGISLNPDNWLVRKETPEELHIMKREGIKAVRVWNKKEKCWSR